MPPFLTRRVLRAHGKLPPERHLRSRPVDLLSEQLGAPGVACALLDHVGQQPSHALDLKKLHPV